MWDNLCVRSSETLEHASFHSQAKVESSKCHGGQTTKEKTHAERYSLTNALSFSIIAPESIQLIATIHTQKRLFIETPSLDPGSRLFWSGQSNLDPDDSPPSRIVHVSLP